MSVTIQEKELKNGKKVKMVEITGEHYPYRLGLKKAKAVLANHKDIELLLAQLGVQP